MSIFRGDPKQALLNREKFLSKIGISPDLVFDVRQIHSSKVIKVTKDSFGQNIEEADGLITNQPDIYLMIKAADCHQIAFYDPKSKSIALIHAGWKGLENGIIGKTVQKMERIFKTRSKDLVIQFGPAIGPCCYRMDIWTQAINQLKSFGVLSKNIDKPGICTYHTNKYFSHRRAEDKNQDDFRFATILGLKTV